MALQALDSMQMITNFHLRLQNSKTLVIGGVMGVYMKNLACSPISVMVNFEFYNGANTLKC